MIGTADAEAFKGLLRAHSRKEKASNQVELQARRADASTFKATVEFASATFEGEPCLQIVFRRQQVDAALIEQLQRDPVTGLFNRARTLETIDEAVSAAAKGKKGQTLLLIEPDNWQSIVAGIGLGQADELLAAFAGRVSALLGESDVAGLLAEHTIGVMLDTRSDEAIKQWIDGLLQAVASDIFDAGTRSITVTASIGGSLLGEKNANAELLLNQASQALRNAQSQGGGRMELHDPAAREKAEEERERYWLQLLKQALAQDNFVLYHQHTISLQDAEGEYSEVLLRMNGPQGEVLPGFFMPIAEKHQLTPAIDRWVINRAIDVLKARDGQGIQTTFFVKLTADSMQDATFLPWLEERLKRAALRQGQIVLEMTESKVVTLLRPAQEFITRWKKMGGRFALEQFGSGLNSFQLLTHIDADYLKIDRTYMNQLPQHPENQKKIGEICVQAHEMKRLTVAEWVEDATSTSLLFACGVDFVQGNFLQEPQRLL
jgi:diguanylate cyclase (GGDEF)-like protein